MGTADLVKMSHFMDVNTEAQGEGGICPKPRSKLKLDLKLEPRAPGLCLYTMVLFPLEDLMVNSSTRHW